MFIKDLYGENSERVVSTYQIDMALWRLAVKDKRTVQVIKLYYSGWTLKKIAGIIENRSKKTDKKFGVKREQAMSILADGMRRLRHPSNYWK
jgi:hypothetical protein